MDSQNIRHPQRHDPKQSIRTMFGLVHNLSEFMPRNGMEWASKIIIEERDAASNLADLPPSLQLIPPLSRPLDPLDNHLLTSMLLEHLRRLQYKLLNLENLCEVVDAEAHINVRLLEELNMQVRGYYSLRSDSFELPKELKTKLIGIIGRISDLVAEVPDVPETPDLPARSQIWVGPSEDELIENNGRIIKHLPGLHEIAGVLPKFEAFRQVEQKFMELEIKRKMCLLSFAVFPENRQVHRTMLMYWWIGEGILPVEGAEETVRDILKLFTDKKLVEPVQERSKITPSSYKMNPFVHSSVMHLSHKIGLFNIYHERQKPSTNNSEMGKVCLVEGLSKKQDVAARILPSRDKIETVFNVSERYPEFTFKWFSEHPSDKKLIRLSKPEFKSLHVFYLGRWERTQKRDIQVSNHERMKCLKFMKNLRVLSFQGISTIRRLKSSVCKLHKLIVLDLRECFDLTQLPEKIDSLRSLVYLDMTGCYMLEWIPMRLAALKNLEVLKGFVVSDTTYEDVACTLSLLTRLKNLRKLSIKVHRDDVGVHQLMEDLVKLKKLTSLKVTWKRDFNIVRAGKPEDFTEIKSLPVQLKKLDLQCFPHEQLPTWLHPQNLLDLKKLHIGGGRLLNGFGDLPKKPTKCAVEILRLSSLPRLRIRWIELKQIYFPNLALLEKCNCPRVILTPCDGNGIWRSDQDD